jgi:hypothetical protein
MASQHRSRVSALQLFSLIQVGFQILTAAIIKMSVFWVVRRVIWQKFSDAPEVLAASIIRAVITLWNVGTLLPDNTAQQPRRQPASQFNTVDTLIPYYLKYILILSSQFTTVFPNWSRPFRYSGKNIYIFNHDIFYPENGAVYSPETI